MTTQRQKIIDHLKKNRYPWGMWLDPDCYGPELGKEMQEKAEDIGKKAFLWWVGGDWTDCLVAHFRPEAAYHLRPDYAEEQEIEECEIYTIAAIRGFHAEVYDFGGRREVGLAFIPDGYKRVGFKFKDGTVHGSPIKYSVPGITSHGYYASYDDLKTKQALEHHAISVLFRRQT